MPTAFNHISGRRQTFFTFPEERNCVVNVSLKLLQIRETETKMKSTVISSTMLN